MRIGELLILGFRGTTIPAWLRDFEREFGLGGVVLFDRDYTRSATRVRRPNAGRQYRMRRSTISDSACASGTPPIRTRSRGWWALA